MFDVCTSCGERLDEHRFSNEIALHLCPFCGHKEAYRRQPLFVITGASGSGKSTIALPLARRLQTATVLETDLFLGATELDASNDYIDFRDYCLRVARDVGQSGKPVVLVGTATPGQYEKCQNSGFFRTIHYLALVCQDAILEDRLRGRPHWRGVDTQGIAKMVEYNDWLKDRIEDLDYDVRLLDNSTMNILRTVDTVIQWVESRL
ncbi:MAG: AAA family ATPase [Anaerolineae bacterium]|nr:AAA family ATPase [Anaerolineae bacterium]